MAENANDKHEDSLTALDRAALFITKIVGTMWCAIAFTILALISLPEAIHGGVATMVAWTAQTFIQLVLLSIIMVGQNLDSRHSEKRADAMYDLTVKTEELLEKVDQILESK
jgi:uncharacterized membrane protein